MGESSRKPGARALTMVILALALCLGPSAAASGASGPLSWSAPRLIDRAPPFSSGTTVSSISCPSTALCVAVNVSGDAVVSTDPAAGNAFSWKPHHVDGVARLESVSCPSRSLCVAVDQAGGVVSTARPTASGSWRRVAIDRGHDILGISCPSTSLCVAFDDAGNVLASTAPRGGPRAWKRTHVDRKPSDNGAEISCASPKLCVVMVNLGPPATSKEHYDVVSSTHPNGGAGAWRTVAGVRKQNIFALTCLPSRLCLAGGDRGNVVSATNPAGGTTAWHVSKGVNASEMSIACASASLCVMGDDDGDVASSTTPTAGKWTSVNIDNNSDGTGRSIVPMTCSSVTLCVGADDVGNIIVSTHPLGGASAWKLFLVDGGSGLLEVSCPSQALCVARDTAGKVLTSTRPGGGAAAWKAVRGLSIAPSLASFESTTLFDLSCPSVSLCVTGDGQRIFATTNPTGGASAWHSTGVLGDDIESITCGSPSMCVALQSHPKHGFVSVFSSQDPAGGSAGWTDSAPRVPFSEFVSDASCPSAALCVATSDVAIASTRPTGGNAAWKKSANLPEEVDVVSCPSSKLCVGIDAGANLVTTTNPTGPTWKTTKLPRSEGLTYVTCATDRLCVGVGGTDILTTTNPTGGAHAWHVTHVRGTTGTHFVAADCASASFCVAVSDDGYVVVGTHRRH